MAEINNTEKEEKYWKEMTVLEKASHIYGQITLEPMYACFILPSKLMVLSLQNLNLEKACQVNLGYNQTVCDALRNRSTANYLVQEVEVQKLVAAMTVWKTSLNSAIPCILIMFFGSWSDRHGKRKPCIIFPLMGLTLMAFSLLLCVYFERTPIEIAIFVQVFFVCLTGSNFMLTMGIFSYINDITTKENRTLRIGIVSLIQSIGEPFGMAFSGVLLNNIGITGAFVLSGLSYLTAVLYGIFILKEVPTRSNVPNQKIAKKSFLADFFDLNHIKDTFKMAFKSGVKRHRLKVLTLMAAVFIVVGPQHAEKPELYLFTRYKFNWSEVEYSFFSTYSMTLQLIGASFSVSVISSVLKIDDALVGAMSTFSRVLSSFVYGFAQFEWHMYVGPIVEIIGTVTSIAMRSIASKIVTSSESGKINSLFGIVESFAPMIYAPIIATIYRSSLTTMPGLFFLVGGVTLIPGVVLFIWIYVINKADRKDTTNSIQLNETHLESN